MRSSFGHFSALGLNRIPLCCKPTPERSLSVSYSIWRNAFGQLKDQVLINTNDSIEPKKIIYYKEGFRQKTYFSVVYNGDNLNV